MKSVNKILTVFASACFTLSSCDIDPVLTSSYPDDITWSNETNLQLYINGFYSLIGGYYSITDDACADLLKANIRLPILICLYSVLLLLLLPVIFLTTGIIGIPGN